MRVKCPHCGADLVLITVAPPPPPDDSADKLLPGVTVVDERGKAPPVNPWDDAVGGLPVTSTTGDDVNTGGTGTDDVLGQPIPTPSPFPTAPDTSGNAPKGSS